MQVALGIVSIRVGLGRRGAFLILAVAAIFGMTGSAPAHASFGIAAFDGQVSADAAGSPYTQAGGHPYAASTTFRLNLVGGGISGPPDEGYLKDVTADLPVGFAGNPTVVPRCRPADFAAGLFLNGGSGAGCPPASQVGLAIPVGLFGALPASGVYSLDPPPGVAAEFAFAVTGGVPVFLDATVRPDDYGLRVRARGIGNAITVVVTGSEITFWGAPAASAHDAQRCAVALAFGGPPQCLGSPGDPVSGPNPANTSVRPFLSNPTFCTAAGNGLVTKLHISSYDGKTAEANFESHDPPGYTLATPLDRSEWGQIQGPTGCERLPFAPSMTVRPDSTAPDSPSGLAVDLAFPQEGLENPEGIGTAHLRRARITLPEGMTISPSAADGLQACSDAQLAFGTNAPVRCPEGSKVGSVVATTPLLDNPIEGAVYVGSQRSDNPESGEMFRIFLVLEDKRHGLLVKLMGKVRANENTGRLETVFDDNPQLPVSKISLRLKGGPRAPLATPPTCGQKTVDAELTSWSGKKVALSDSFEIECTPDLATFAPGFDAGTILPKGGAFSPFVVRLDRPDRQQYLSGVALEMPRGLSAKLKGVPLCGETQAAEGSCPPETRVGTATVGTGPGGNPFFVSGPVFLTGPYKGAPNGLAVVVRALAGPFDLGTIVVRQAIYVDPVDGHLTASSDPLPTIVKGVPARVRSVNVTVNRPGFTLNPTSCAEKQLNAALTSTQGVLVAQTVRFQVGECRSLPFTPKLSLRLTGPKQTADGEHPGLKAVLTQLPKQANIRSAKVKLPLSLALDPENAASDSLCEFEEGQKIEPNCPRSSIIGHARATTPLLNRPLTGNVYFVKNVRKDKRTGRAIRTLPTLLIPLRGEIALNLRAQSSISNGALVNSFQTVPDAAVTRFELSLKGGPKGILVVTNDRNLCHGRQVASTDLAAQNGKRSTRSTAMKTPCRR